MNRKFLTFLIKCISIPAVAVLILLALNKPYRKIDASKYQDLLKYTTLGIETDRILVSNVGSSHGVYNFNYSALKEQGISCFNYGGTSQTYNYDYAILQEYGSFLKEGGVMFIPVSYFSFNDEVANASEKQALSVRYYHCLSPETMPDYDYFTDFVVHKYPVLSAGHKLFELLPSLSLKVFAAESGVDEEIFAARTKERYERHFAGKAEYFRQERIDELYEVIGYCKERNITPVLVTTPFSHYYNDLVSEEFLEEFHTTIKNVTDTCHVSYYDYSSDPRFCNDLSLFMDSDHLTDEGAEYFVSILAREVPELQKIIRDNNPDTMQQTD